MGEQSVGHRAHLLRRLTGRMELLERLQRSEQPQNPIAHRPVWIAAAEFIGHRRSQANGNLFGSLSPRPSASERSHSSVRQSVGRACSERQR